MKKRRAYDICIWVIALIMMLCALWIFFYNSVVYLHVKTGDVKTFTGSYSVEEIHLHRNTVNFITLENGDRLLLLPEWVEESKFDGQYKELAFAYSAPYRPLCGAYTTVNIQTTDSQTEIVETDTALKEAGISMITGFLLSAISGTIVCIIFPFRKRQDTHRRKKRVSFQAKRRDITEK